MSAKPAAAEAAKDDAEPPAKKGGKRKLILLAIPLVLVLAGAGLWFSGILPGLLGMEKHEEHEAEKKVEPPSYVDLPEMVANLNGAGHKPSYIKVVIRIEVLKSGDLDRVRTLQPRLQDIMQTYLREMRPEELRGSAGTYRLREELLNRVNVAVAPAKVSDVLFTQMLVQ
ncbi:MAG: flagellar basal body-associated FliL family protein [Rhodospirillales bacterium]|nr:flagellar basal body-associated FliL family protein [Acetobacter sp.]